jgi:hypothetical protein
MSMMRAASAVTLAATLMMIGGCGTYVPEIQENPFASVKERSDFIQAIARNVRCEVQDAVVDLYASQRDIDPQNRNLKWFDSWAAQISLTLTTDEKGSVNPVVNVTPLSPLTSVFNINLGATVSTEAQRVNKIGSFFSVADLKKLQACPPEDRHRGPFILESDLKLEEWLIATMISTGNGDTPAPADQSGPFKSNVLSHEVKFDIISTGTVTPAWKLTRATVNQTGTFLSGSRDRTQDLTITFGPIDPAWSEFVIDLNTGRAKIDPVTRRPMVRPTALAPAASSAALSADISNAISNGIRNAQRP